MKHGPTNHFAPQKDCVFRINLIGINQIFVFNVSQMMWSEVDTWFTAQKLTLWEVFLHGFSPTRMHTHTPTANSIMQVTYFNFTPPDKENNM
jgi:hypothetical protein